MHGWGLSPPQLQVQCRILLLACLAGAWRNVHHEHIGSLNKSARSSACITAIPRSWSGAAPLFCQEGCHSLVGDGCGWVHATCSREDQWDEGPLLHFDDPLLICPSLLSLITPVRGCQGVLAAALCVWVEHPYVKKCTLLLVPPEALGTDVCTSIVFSVCCPIVQLLACEGLKGGLNADTGADLCKNIRCDVPNVIVAHGFQPTTGATESMFYTELLPADAVRGQVWKLPPIPWG